MGLDCLSPVAPARVRCLLLPYGRISRPRFLEFVERLQQEPTVRLGDISPNDGAQRDMFSPLEFPEGTVVYDMRVSDTAASHRSLVPFELYRETLVVLAIIDGREYSSQEFQDREQLGNRNTGLSEVENCVSFLKANYSTALVHRALLFDFALAPSNVPPGFISLPPKEHAPPTSLKTVMCDVTSLLLLEMASFAKSVQALPNIPTPKSTTPVRVEDDSNPNGSRSRSSGIGVPDPRMIGHMADHSKQSHRASLPVHLSASMASELSSGGFGPRNPEVASKPPSTTFDDMSGLPGRSSIAAGQANRDSVPKDGFGSGSFGERARNQAQSRIGIVTGSMYILAGQWADALRTLTTAATAAKASSDYAWYAKALDYLLVTLLMYAWAGIDFDIPQICYPFGERSSVSGSKPTKQPPTNEPSSEAPEPNLTAKRSISLQHLSSLLPDLANNILHLYSRAAQFNSDQVPQIVYSDTTIRLAKILSLTQASFGVLDSIGLRTVVLSQEFQPDRRPSTPKVPYLSKADIAQFLYRAMPTAMAETTIDIVDRLTVLAGISSVLAFLGYHRKKALVLREFMTTLLPALVQSRKDSAAELGVHPAASLSALDLTGSEGDPREISQSVGSELAMQKFLALICDVYGVIVSTTNDSVDSRAEKLDESNMDQNEDITTISKRALKNALKRSFGNPQLKMDILRLCINICEALPDLAGILRFSSDLMRTAGSGIAPGPETVDGFPSIPIEDQVRLMNNISRTVSAAKQLGFEGMEAEYWDEFLVRDITVLENSSYNTPLPRKKAELNLASAGIASESKGPFIFNPFAAKPVVKNRESLLVANEETTFILLLQNLYDVDLEIEWIKFDIMDTKIDSLVRGIVIGPYRTQKVHLPSIPRSIGRLKIDGCIAKVKGCKARRFPLFKSSWRLREEVKMKRIGLLASTIPSERPLSTGSNSGSNTDALYRGIAKAASFEADVIAAQPTLVLKSTSLPQSAIMLFEGERRTFSITIQNISETPADVVLFSFRDSTSERLQSFLGKTGLPPSEVYEAEVSAYQTPVLQLTAESQKIDFQVSAKGELTVEVEIFGKTGLVNGAVHLEYGHIGIPKSEIQDQIYTRQLSVQFSVTVSTCIELAHNDFLPFDRDIASSGFERYPPLTEASVYEPDETAADEADPNPSRSQLHVSETSNTDSCLALVDFHNSWSDPARVFIQILNTETGGDPSPTAWEGSETFEEMIQPYRTSRIIRPFLKLLVQDYHAPIPSLNPKNKRQFVLSASKISPELERLARETFWYREKALSRIRATWSIPARKRHGTIDLRRLSVSPRMLDALRRDELDISISLSSSVPMPVPEASSSISSASFPPKAKVQAQALQELSPKRFRVPTSAFLNLTTTLTSHLSQPIYPLLRLQPALRTQPYNVALDLGRKLAFNGVLQRALAPLGPGESRSVAVGMVFLAAGDYEIGACVEEVRPWRSTSPARAESTAAGGAAASGGSGGEANDNSVEARRGKPRAGSGDFGLLGPERARRRAWYARDACVVDVRAVEMEE